MNNLIHVRGAAGVDEAGRGPLAGPVVACAVILPDEFELKGIQDSKKLSREAREFQCERIIEQADFGIGWSFPDEIDTLNILWASMIAMERAISQLQGFSQVLIDGNQIPKGLKNTHNFKVETVIKGDSKYACIAAASILAKVTRDRYMAKLSAEYPNFQFDRHFGYPTPLHLAELEQNGPSQVHRNSFGPVQRSVAKFAMINISESQKKVPKEITVGLPQSSLFEDI